jgi:photosystem II stability/assembly factor-like uncharacterized protein
MHRNIPWFVPILILVVTAGALTSAPRYDQWKVIGPGGGGGQFAPTISPHDSNRVFVACDMTGSYISQDGGKSWRMFNLGNRTDFFVFDPVDPKVVYAKTVGPPPTMSKDRPLWLAGLWRSTDTGRTWRLVRADPRTVPGNSAAGPAGDLMALAVDPGNSRMLYVVLREDRSAALYISKDWGRNWENAGELPGGGREIYIDPRSPAGDRTLYVTGMRSVAIREAGRWSSGETLPGAETGGRGRSPASFSLGFPADGGLPVVYASTAAAAFVSEDGGRSWRRSEFPGFSPRFKVVATSIRHPDVAYLSYDYRPPEGNRFHGVAKTADRGHTWELVWKESDQPAPNILDAWLSERFGPGWGGSPFNLGVAPTDPNICYGTDSGRTMRTTDGGKTWKGVYSARLPDGSYTTTGLDVTTCYGVHFDPFDPKRIFISYTDIALFRSDNGGKSWVSSSDGVPRKWLNTTYWIAFDPDVKGRVWGAMSGAHDLPRPKMWTGRSPVGYPGGVCRSDDGGKTWAPSNAGMPETPVTHILLDPKSPKGARVLYATGFAHGVFKSTDDGAHWAPKNNGITEKEPFAWRLAMDNRGVLYLVVARRSDDGSIGGKGDGALYRSSDGAEHWTRAGLPEGTNGPHGLAVDPQNPQCLYLAAWGRRPDTETTGGGIFLSTDGGATWRHVLSKDQHIYDITIDSRDPKILYASGFEASAWRSADRGETWTRLRGFNFKWGHRVFPDPIDSTKIYITTYGGSVWHGPAQGDPDATEDTAGSAWSQ